MFRSKRKKIPTILLAALKVVRFDGVRKELVGQTVGLHKELVGEDGHAGQSDEAESGMILHGTVDNKTVPSKETEKRHDRSNDWKSNELQSNSKRKMLVYRISPQRAGV